MNYYKEGTRLCNRCGEHRPEGEITEHKGFCEECANRPKDRPEDGLYLKESSDVKPELVAGIRIK